MRKYWVDEILEVGVPVSIGGDLFKHIHLVCRQGPGDKFELISSTKECRGQKYLVEVLDIHKHKMVVSILSEETVPLIPKPHLTLALSIPKIKTVESVVEKIVELGVYSLSLFYSDFSFLKSRQRLEEKLPRLKKIAASACQQSGRTEELDIQDSLSFKELIERFKLEREKSNAIGLAFYEGEAQALSDFFNKTEGKLTNYDNVWIFVGSEGGFSVEEVESFKAAEVPSLSLGKQVLRVETACVSIVSVLKYELGLYEGIKL